MTHHFHVIVCFYFCSVGNAVLPTEEYSTKPLVSEQCEKSRVLGCGYMDLRPIRSLPEANFREEIHQVVLSVHN
jgi:hypothetical protein